MESFQSDTTEETPEQTPEQIKGDYDGPKGKQDLPKDVVNDLKTICQKIDQRELPARLEQVARAQKARLFQRGNQYLQRRTGVTEVGTQGTIYAPIQDEDDDRKYTYNLYLGYQKSFVATFAQAPVGVRPEPNDPMISSDVEAAREADSMKRLICKANNQKDLQKQIARYLWTDGIVVFYCYESTEDRRFGMAPDGSERPYPKIEVGGALEWKVPIASGDFASWDYVRRQREMSVWKAKDEYPEKRKQIGNVAGQARDVDYSRQARLSVAEGLGLIGQSGDAQSQISTESCYWLRPSAFNEIEDDTRRGILETFFPSGARVCFIGSEYMRSSDESLDDHIDAFQAVDGDGWSNPGLGNSAVGPQESFNDGMNLAQTTFMRCVPHSFFDDKLIPADARKNQKSRPGEGHPCDLAAGEDMRAKFYTEPNIEAPATLVTYLDNLQGPLTQFLTGQQPALFGGEMGEAGKTASGYQQALAQAMGLMGLVWVPFKKSWAKVIGQCVKIAGEAYEAGTVLSTIMSENNGDQTTVTVNVDNLKGNILWYPETDENFPESWTSKKAAYTNLMMSSDKNPVLGGILAHPDNLRLAKDLVGIPDLTIPGADACEKQMKEIEEMEKQPPVPDPQATQQIRAAEMQGQQVPPQMLANIPMVSSVDLGKYDDDQNEFQTCVRWINSPTGQKAKRQNPQWFQNVELHADAHKARMDQAKGGPQQKPPGETINLKDLPPSGKIQMAAQAGITLNPSEVIAMEEAKNAPKNGNLPPQ